MIYSPFNVPIMERLFFFTGACVVLSITNKTIVTPPAASISFDICTCIIAGMCLAEFGFNWAPLDEPAAMVA